MKDLLSLTYRELEEYIISLGEPVYRAKQIMSWLNKGCDIEEMNNIPKALKDKLRQNGACVHGVKLKKKYVSKDGTVKYLFSLFDGELIESVLMNYKHGYSVCISSEAGCPMGCKFCASTVGGLKRKLEPGELLGQVIYAQNDCGEKLSGIVLMGIGEPLDNYDSVLKFLKIVGSAESLNIGYRHISLSTCGIVDKIYMLAKENIPITLSISLHASNDEARSKIMPVNKRWNIEQLLNACSEYFQTTKRKISFEYSLANGVNDTPKHARELAAVLKKYCKDMPLHVNLIPINETGRGFSPSENSNIRMFVNILTNERITATVRRHLGGDINASCGQLRSGEVE